MACRDVKQLDDPDAARELEEELVDAREAAQRVRQITRDLRIFSRADEVSSAPIDVRLVVESSLRMARNEIRHTARLVTRFDPTPPVLGNESRLGQVILNLVINAAQAIVEGNAEHNEIHVRTFVRDGQVGVSISDTGTGMSAEVQRRLFRPFFTTKPAGVGTGLGLSICLRIVTEMGGEISVDSAPGEGSTFTVLLPAAPREAERAVPPPRTVAPHSRRGRILVVDDEKLVGEAIRRTLASAHQVVVVQQGAEVLALLEAGERFDLVLSDLMMPQMSGMELFERIGGIDAAQAERVVFLTGGAFSAAAHAFLEDGQHQRLDKPFSPEALRAFVAERVHGCEPAAQA
jgi:CheY-like chemotaxis protein/anti-sigma regulatory factor (Ser/Thr protein kinase)